MVPTGVIARWREPALFALAVALFTSAVMTAVATAWSHDLRRPRIVLLGSGHQLSALVTGGRARLPLATGDDPVAFSNALERPRHPTTRRLDVLLVAGAGNALLAPAS